MNLSLFFKRLYIRVIPFALGEFEVQEDHALVGIMTDGAGFFFR